MLLGWLQFLEWLLNKSGIFLCIYKFFDKADINLLHGCMTIHM